MGVGGGLLEVKMTWVVKGFTAPCAETEQVTSFISYK